MNNEIYQNELFEGFGIYSASPRKPSQIRQSKTFDVTNRQSVRNSQVDLSTLSNTSVSFQKDGWSIKKMFDLSYLSPKTEWTFDESEKFKAKIVDFQMTRGKLENNYDCYYLNVIYMINLPDIGIKLVKQDGLSANFTSGSNLAQYLFALGFNLYEMQEFNPQDLIGIDVWIGIERNENGFFTVNYVEKINN